MSARPDWHMPEPRDIAVVGTRIRYWDIGEGTPLVLVHGFSGSATFEWGRVMDLLAQHHRVIALQVIGFEPSERPDIVYSTETLTDHLGAFFRALDLTDITLVGESFGGWLVASYAARQPGSDLPAIARLVVVAGAICMTRRPAPDARSFVDDEVAREVEDLYARMPAHDHEPTRALILRDSDLGKEYPSANDLARINVPTLLLWGDRDESVPHDCGERADAVIPGARLVVLPNVGHIPSVEVPRIFARIVANFAAGE